MAKRKPSKKKAQMPAWPLEPFRHFLEEANRLTGLVRISCMGIEVVKIAPTVYRTLMRGDDDDKVAERKKHLKGALTDAELAKHESENGFPILHAWAVVNLWTIYESIVRTFVAEWLKHKPTAWRIEPIQRLRISLGDYESIPKIQRNRYVVELLERDLAVGLKAGVSRSEALLKPFGLAGELPDNLKRGMYEMSQVRNLIVHNASKVDRRFVEACPWLKSRIGDDFRISHEMFCGYSFYMRSYISILICRVGEQFGVDMSTPYQEALEGLQGPNAPTP